VHREAITHSQLQHPNIIPFLGIYHDSLNSPPLTIVPFWGRGSLSSMLSRQWPIPTAIFQCILIGITRGVGYLHSQNPPVIHGDLHPGNILLDDFGNPQICGFGTSRICCMLNKTRVARQESKRMRFMAPELITLKLQEINPTQKSDIFSLAMTFFNVWTGRPPFSEVTRDWEVLLGFAKGRRPKRTPQTMLSREMQPTLWKLLEKMWNQKPSKRPSIATVIERFKTMFTLAFPYPSPPEYSGGFGTLVYSLSRHNSYPPMTSELPQSLFSADSPEAECNNIFPAYVF
ncbi:kinase-like protein, partial [Clavulina sp. PMI_390]